MIRLTAEQYRARSKLGWIKRRANGKGANAATNWLHKRADGTYKLSKRGKYNAKGRHIDGHWLASKAEADRYGQLLEMRDRGMISELEMQPEFPCRVNGQLVCVYRADFRYRIRPGQLGSRVIIEDVKGMATDEYKLKRKLVHALHPIEIMEIRVPKRGGIGHCRLLTADQVGKAPGKEEAWLNGSSTGLLRSSGGSQS
jgi:Protein of unknown function (DUF1064)